MAKHRAQREQTTPTINKMEVLSWLESLPLAPEYYPTLEEFQDPIAFILKIENEASKYGICKIIPPVSLPSEKTTVNNLNRSLSSHSASSKTKSSSTFTTREQKVGLCPRRHRPLKNPIRQSGLRYTLRKFEKQANSFKKNYLNKVSETVLNPLEIETLYWRATADHHFSVEYASDMPGSAFVALDDENQGREEALTVGDTAWNMRGVSRVKGSVLRYVNEDIPGVTSPMVYMGMLFSWFAWHVEDHDLHSLNYMHMGAAKTWYGVPENAAVALEEVVRSHCYGGETNAIAAFATLSNKTTVMSPEVLLNAGVPCCRLVQNAGEFVVTFPRAYHSGFSHGFNCAEATNIATPEWLRFAEGAAICRASIEFPPLVSHIQLLYSFALSLSSRVPISITSEPRSSGLREKNSAGESLVKELFVQDVMQNTNLLYSLGKGSPIITFPQDIVSISPTQTMYTEGEGPDHIDGCPTKGMFSCVSCGVLCFACIAIIQPNQEAAQNLLSADCSNFIGSNVTSEIHSDWQTCASGDANTAQLDTNLGRMVDNSSLTLLALTYGDSSDSDEHHPRADVDDSSTDSVKNRMITSASDSNEDSCRLYVFCLQHAVEVEQKLRPFGGVRMLLLCHPDFPKLQAEAKLMADELGSDSLWHETTFRAATNKEELSINSALNSEEVVSEHDDWTVKLGANIFYSARLSHSSKKMPHNSVMHKAFGHRSSVQTRKVSGEGLTKALDHKSEGKAIIQYQRRSKSRVNVMEKTHHQENIEPCKKRAKTVAADVETDYVCDMKGCTLSFHSERELALHQQNICPLKGCRKQFSSHRHLIRHRKVHDNEHPLKCPLKGCNMTFKWGWARTKHVKAHVTKKNK